MENKFELTKELLKDILEEKEEKFTLEEIEQLMDSEVEKPEDEMDTELVDMCASILAKAYNPDFKEEKPEQMYCPWEKETVPESKPETVTPEKPKKKIIPFKRVLIAVAAIVIIAVVALTAGATLFRNSESDGIIGLYKDFFRINVNDEETATDSVIENDLVNQMILDSLNTKPLPQVLLSDEYEKSVGNIIQEDEKSVIYINISNVSDTTNGYLMITQYKNAEYNMTNGQANVPEDTYRNFKELSIEGKEIIVFGRDEQSYINYSDGAINYQITLECDFDTMVSIAETITVKG